MGPQYPVIQSSSSAIILTFTERCYLMLLILMVFSVQGVLARSGSLCGSSGSRTLHVTAVCCKVNTSAPDIVIVNHWAVVTCVLILLRLLYQRCLKNRFPLFQVSQKTILKTTHVHIIIVTGFSCSNYSHCSWLSLAEANIRV